MKINKAHNNYFGLNFIATGKETDDKYFLSETIIPAGDVGPPLHYHSKESEAFYIKEGELEFTVENVDIKLKAGEFLNIEKGEKHTWRNTSDVDAKVLVVFTPAGIENMFIELDKGLIDIAHTEEKYGTVFLV